MAVDVAEVAQLAVAGDQDCEHRIIGDMGGDPLDLPAKHLHLAWYLLNHAEWAPFVDAHPDFTTWDAYQPSPANAAAHDAYWARLHALAGGAAPITS